MTTQHYLPPAPLNAPAGSLAWAEWYRLMRQVAESGQTAYILVNDPTTGLQGKLNSDAADTLNGTISFGSSGAFKVGTVTWNGTSATGTGVMFTQNGIVGANSGTVKFVIKSDGTATFGGQLTAATGSFGAVTVDTAGSISSGKTSFTSTTAGYWLDATSGGRIHVGNSSSYWKWDGSSMLFAGDVLTSGGVYATGYSNNSITVNGITYDPSIFGSVSSTLGSNTPVGILGSCAVNSGGTGISAQSSGAATGATTRFRGLDAYAQSSNTNGDITGVNTVASGGTAAMGIYTKAQNNSSGSGKQATGISCESLTTNSSTANRGVFINQSGGSSSTSAGIHVFSDTGTALRIGQGGIRIDDTSFVGTGASTGTYVGTNKPGSNSNNTWLKININGTDYYIPIWT